MVICGQRCAHFLRNGKLVLCIFKRMYGVETKTAADIIKKLCVNNNPLSQARLYINLERRNFHKTLNLKYRLQMTVLEEFNYNYAGTGFYIISMHLTPVYKFIQRKKNMHQNAGYMGLRICLWFLTLQIKVSDINI